MKRLFLLLLVPAMAMADPLPSWPVLKATNGTEYRDVRVTAVEAGGIKIVHSAGITRLSSGQLPPEVRALFNFDAAKAASEEQARKEKDVASRQKTAAEAEGQMSKEAETAARGRLTYETKTFLVQEKIEGGFMAFLLPPEGPPKRRAILGSSNTTLLPRDDGPVSTTPVFLESGGDYGSGDKLTGIVAPYGTVMQGEKYIRRWVLQSGKFFQKEPH